jgi:multiple sugar transport system permease protein
MRRHPLRHVVLAAAALLWLSPLYFVVINAGRPSESWGDVPLWEPSAPFVLFENMAEAWRLAELGKSIASSLLYASVGGVAAVLLAALAAFGIVVLRIRHGFAWFMLLYTGTVLPLQVFLTPLWELFQAYGLYDRRTGLLLLYTSIAIPFAVFVLRNFFGAIPTELREAAQVDGASSWRIFWQIYIPLSWSALASLFIFQFTWIWNDLLFGLTLSRSINIRPIMTALAALQGGYSSTSTALVLAGAVVVALPMVALFLALQRLFVEGLSLRVEG